MSPAFPIERSLTSDLGPLADIEMTSTVRLLSDGRIRVDNSATGLTDIAGGFVGVVVALYRELGDRSNALLWTSHPVRYGLGGKWIGRSHVGTSFTRQSMRMSPRRSDTCSSTTTHHLTTAR